MIHSNIIPTINKNSTEENIEKVKFPSGSFECPYKLAIIGGGPSGCSIVIRSIRIGVIDELCNFTCIKNPLLDSTPEYMAGICIIDQNGLDKFGGGKLQDYVINSNTSGNKFVENVIEDKPENLPKETVKKTALANLSSHQSSVDLLHYGYKIAPLYKVGTFLRDTGSIVHQTLNEKFKDSSRCLLNSKVTCLQKVDLTNGSGWKITISTRLNEKTVNSTIFAVKVALATGGIQELPLLPNQSHSKKLMSSDYALTENGIKDLRARLIKNTNKENNGSPGKVVIVGGSHSAFSAAWVCLNKLSTNKDLFEDSNNTCKLVNSPLKSPSWLSNNIKASSTPIHEDGAIQFSTSGICLIHKSDIKVFYTSKTSAESDKYTYMPDNLSTSIHVIAGGGIMGVSNGNNSKALNLVRDKITGHIHPFGGLRGDAKQLWRAIKEGKENRVRMLQIKQNVITLQNNTSGNYQSNIKQQAITEKLFDEAVVIIWACGYTSNLQDISILEKDGKTPIQLKTSRGQVEVDNWARILQDNNATSSLNVVSKNLEPTISTVDVEKTTICYTTVTNNIISKVSKGNNKEMPIVASPAPPNTDAVDGLFGSGLGFGLQVLLENGQPDGSSGRADGVAIYLKRGATLILAQILGNKVFGGNDIKSWDERNQLLKKIRLAATELSTVKTEICSPTNNNNNNNDNILISKSNATSKRPSTSTTLYNSRDKSIKSNHLHQTKIEAVSPKETAGYNNNNDGNGTFINSDDLRKLPFPFIEVNQNSSRPFTTSAFHNRSNNVNNIPDKTITSFGSNESLFSSQIQSPPAIDDDNNVKIMYDIKTVVSHPIIVSSNITTPTAICYSPVIQNKPIISTSHNDNIIMKEIVKVNEKSCEKIVKNVSNSITLSPISNLNKKNKITVAQGVDISSGGNRRTSTTIIAAAQTIKSLDEKKYTSASVTIAKSSPRLNNLAISKNIVLSSPSSKLRTISANSLSPRKKNVLCNNNMNKTICHDPQMVMIHSRDHIPPGNISLSSSGNVTLPLIKDSGNSKSSSVWINPLNGNIVRVVQNKRTR